MAPLIPSQFPVPSGLTPAVTPNCGTKLGSTPPLVDTADEVATAADDVVVVATADDDAGAAAPGAGVPF